MDGYATADILIDYCFDNGVLLNAVIRNVTDNVMLREDNFGDDFNADGRRVFAPFLTRLKDWRRGATRYDRCPKVFLSAIALAALVSYWI